MKSKYTFNEIEELLDKISKLKISDVTVSDLLTNGKKIATIHIDNFDHNLYAPATYAWSEITSKPTSLAGYGLSDEITGFLANKANTSMVVQYFNAGWGADWAKTKTDYPSVLVGFNSNEVNGVKGDYGILNIPVWTANAASLFYATQIYSVPNGANLTWRQVTASANGAWKVLLDDHNYESIVGNKFLKLSGGTIQNLVGNMCPLYLLGNNTYVALGLSIGKNQPQAYLAFDGNELRYVKPDTSWNTLLHAGNVKDYALKTDGSNQMYAPLRLATITDLTKEKGLYVGRTNISGGAAFDYSSFINIYDGQISSLQLSWHRNIVVPKLVARISENGNWSDWKTIAFTDSTVASATKLQTARSLWGNSFDGTADINGDIHLAADRGIIASNGYTVLTAPSYLLLGYAQSELGQTTYLDGNDIYIRYGKNHVPAMYINSSGNVTIGVSDLAKTDHKLWVSGSINARGAIYVYAGMTNSIYSDTSVVFGARTAGFAHGLSQKNSQGADLAAMGFYGSADTLSYIFLGEAYNKTWLQVSSTVASFNSRLLVNGAIDNGSTGLQVIGGAHIQGDIANHLSNILTSGVGTWAKGHFAVNSSGARLGGFGFLVGENGYLNYLFLGLYSNEWLKINAYESIFGVSTKFNAGALIPTGQTLKIGDATLSWDSTANALKVDKDFYSDGQVSSGQSITFVDANGNNHILS